MSDIPLITTPTMWEFMNDPSFVRLIAGPVGSGKSVCCSHELVKLGLQQGPNAQGMRNTRALIVRNTADQLTKTTRKTFFSWFPPGIWGTWKESEKTFLIRQPLSDGTTLNMEVWFMPLDRPDDVAKALSLEITFLWGNEARELHPDVVDGLLARLKRYPSGRDGKPTRSCAIFDTNMPDADTWMHGQMEEPPQNWAIFTQPPAVLNREEWVAQFNEDPSNDPIIGYADTEWWVNPGSDNVQNLDPLYYVDIIPGKKEDYINTYLRCKYGRSLSGLPVYDKTFAIDYHVAKTPFVPVKSTEHPIIIGLDFGRTPAAVFLQRNVYDQLVAFSELTSENMGIETFIDRELRPHIAERYSGAKFIVAPDPAGFAKQQIGEISPADVVKAAGFEVVRPPTNDPERRIQAVERVLSANVGGKPGFVINSECRQLIKGFKHGYRYRLNKQGQQDNTPDKNEFSHCHDALQYGVMIAEGGALFGSYIHRAPRREVKRVRYAWS